MGKGMREFKDSLSGDNDDDDEPAIEPSGDRVATLSRARVAQSCRARCDRRRPAGADRRATPSATRPTSAAASSPLRGRRAVEVVHELENTRGQPVALRGRGPRTCCASARSRTAGAQARHLPLAHALGARTVADRLNFARQLARRRVAHRRASPGGEPDVRSWRIDDGARDARSRSRWMAPRLSRSSARLRDAAIRSRSGSAATAACRWSTPAPRRRRARDRRATSARARSSRSSPRASSSRSPAPATRPRPSSSRACCWRRACRRCCAARAGSTCPTCWPPGRATCSCRARAPRPRARCCCRPTLLRRVSTERGR